MLSVAETISRLSACTKGGLLGIVNIYWRLTETSGWFTRVNQVYAADWLCLEWGQKWQCHCWLWSVRLQKPIKMMALTEPGHYWPMAGDEKPKMVKNGNETLTRGKVATCTLNATAERWMLPLPATTEWGIYLLLWLIAEFCPSYWRLLNGYESKLRKTSEQYVRD